MDIRIDSSFALDDLEDAAPILTTEVAVMDFLTEEGDRAIYAYDYGDGWLHDVLFEGSFPKEPGKKYPICLAGPLRPRENQVLVSLVRCCYHNPVNIKDILAKISATEAPLARQLLMTGLITRRLEERGLPAPILIGGLALSYYTREVYFTADIDLAYADRESLDEVLRELGFARSGRYWVHAGLDIAVEVPASVLAGEEAPRETVELEGGLSCVVIGLEDLIIDRLNACKHWKSEVDCEMTELLIARYGKEIDWAYLEKKAALPENDTLADLLALKGRGAP